DSDGGVHDNQHVRIRSQRPTDYDLLLIAATEAGNRLPQAPSHDLELLDLALGDGVSLRERHDAQALRKPAEQGQGEVLGHAQLRRKAASLTVLRHIADAPPEG